MKPAYIGAAKDRIFSVTGSFPLIQVHEVKDRQAVKVLRWKQDSLPPRFRLIQVSLYYIRTVIYSTYLYYEGSIDCKRKKKG
jgi:hypothetical protein